MDKLMDVVEENVLLVGRFVENRRKTKNLFIVKFQNESGELYHLMIPVNDSALLQSYHEVKDKRCRVMVRSFRHEDDVRYKLIWVF